MEIERLHGLRLSFAGDRRDLSVRISLDEVSGRRIQHLVTRPERSSVRGIEAVFAGKVRVRRGLSEGKFGVMVEFRLHKNQRIEMLRGVNLFSRCSKAELGRVASLTTQYVAEPGDVLTKRGEPASEFFVIVSGEATASRDGVTLAVLGPGSFFGELALLDGGLRTATVVADTDMRLLVLSRSEFSSLMQLVPSVSTKIIEELAARLRKTDELLDPAPALSDAVGSWSL